MANAILSMEEKYFEKSEQFIPERWLRDSDDSSCCPVAPAKNVHPFVYLPFGFGPRACIGQKLADLEIAILFSR